MNWIIRQAQPSDAQAISALILGLADYFLADPSSEQVRPFLDTLTPAATADRIGSPDYRYFVAETPSGVCGVVALRDGSHLYHLFVSPGAHRRGIARALWEHARAGSGAKTFTVNSSLYAVAVYERLGFRSVGAQVADKGLVYQPMEYGPGT